MSLEAVKEAVNERQPGALIEVTERDLREIASVNASHPAAVEFLKAAERRRLGNERAAAAGGRQKDNPLVVDREDILAILENREVIVERVVLEDPIDGVKVPVIRKSLGKKLGQ